MGDEHGATYEWLREQLAGVAPAHDSAARDLLWVDLEHRLAVARDAASRVEVFITGPPLIAATRVVGDALEHDTWSTFHGGELPATRVVFPRGEHLDHVAALLCVELLDNGLHRDAQAAFEHAEPLVALALSRDQVTDQALLGLVGELVFFDQLLSQAPANAISEVLASWAGSSPSARDFQLGSVGIEVKTTQSGSSTHHVQGVHQVELGHSNSGGPETALFLLSLDLSWQEQRENGQTLPALVDSLLARISGSGERAALLARIKQYGGDSAIGYDHERDHGRPRYQRMFFLRFERLYDMSDGRLKLLTSATLAGLDHVDPSSVAFRVVLPAQVRGELNPVVGWAAVTSTLFAAAGYGGAESGGP